MRLNRIFFVLIISLVLCLFNSGCQKDSINGDLDGRWQILLIDENGIAEDVKDQQLYYNFYLHVCNLSTYGGVFTAGNLVFADNKIRMEFPYIQTPVGEEELMKYGIFSNPVEFDVILLSKDRLILKEGDVVITLRKF